MISNKFPININKIARNFVSGMSKGDAMGAVILLETTVTAGRTYQAYKRGGLVEARERGTEETLGAIFWLGGVSAFNKLGDVIGKKLLGLKDINFDVGSDSVRKPFLNFLKKAPNLTKKQLTAFKFTKVISSILISNAIIGFAVPKINQSLTKKYQKSLTDKNQKKEDTQNNVPNKAENIQSEINAESPSFKGISPDTLLSLSYNFENDARYKLLSADAGIAGGRAVNARNKNERREVLFRDLSSIYFYMFCKNHVASALNFIQSGGKKSEILDPASVDILHKHLSKKITDKTYSPKEFEKLVFGTPNAKIPKNIENALHTKNEADEGLITLEKFKKLSNDEGINKIARRMSGLQPKLDGTAILTAEQVKDIYTGGLINDPFMLGKTFMQYSKKKSIDPMAYYPEKDLRAVKSRMHGYIKDIINDATKKGTNISIETLEKANKINFAKNAINLTAGFAVSALFLSTLIPKMQYWLTKKETGENKFPGVETNENQN